MLEVAALYVETDGAYYGLEGVDPWDQERDARLYNGPNPVVAHPPCSTWCQLASVNEARWGKMIGDDDGCFEAALASVREWGGVLEHPAYSLAWGRHDLHRPARGYWGRSFFDEGWVTEVSQAAYGHLAQKKTWLYYVGSNLPPKLDWRDVGGEVVIGASVNVGQPGASFRPRATKNEAIGTPVLFRDALIEMARTAHLTHSGYEHDVPSPHKEKELSDAC